MRDGQKTTIHATGMSGGVVMFFDYGFRFSGSRVPASASSLAVNPPSRPGALGHVRARLLSGAARIALPAASMIVALGVGLPTEEIGRAHV